MLPEFAVQNGLSRAVHVPPPHSYRPLKGTPQRVRIIRYTYGFGQGLTEAQKAGLRYEEKAHAYLRALLGRAYTYSPKVHFDDLGPRVVVPDGLYIREGVCTVFEIKVQHMPEAWWQLRKVYQPVLERLDGVREVRVVEVTKTFDPVMPFPESVCMISDLTTFVKPGFVNPGFGVYLWRP